ncbi:MAG: heparinase, partial [Candidatus Hydrogenedentes bacterium]|nr:heparinase [Candidatus Hydrogenedentota bacterium]
MARCSVWIYIVSIVVLGAAYAQEAVAPVATGPVEVLKTLRAEHPRLMLTTAQLDSLKASAASDPVLADYVAQVIVQADTVLEEAPLEHKLVGPRLLSVSRDCLQRIYTLGVAYRWTGDARYADAIKSNMITVCAFPDWNPSHFLDTAEMSHAVAIGYDWLYDVLTPETRESIRQALIELGLKPGMAVYEGGGKWTVSDFNWNQVCNGGMLIGALAIAETDPQYAEYIVPRAVASLPKALASYAPDGAWMEGPGYWHYATRYTAFALCAMDSALGTDFDLSKMEGLSVTGQFPNYTTGPTGLLLNYADSGERSARKPMACMFWLARKYSNPAISDAEHA